MGSTLFWVAGLAIFVGSFAVPLSPLNAREEKLSAAACAVCSSFFYEVNKHYNSHPRPNLAKVKERMGEFCDALWKESQKYCTELKERFLEKVYDDFVRYKGPYEICVNLGQCH